MLDEGETDLSRPNSSPIMILMTMRMTYEKKHQHKVKYKKVAVYNISSRWQKQSCN